MRELDERLGFGELIEQHLTDSRANNARLSFADLLRQSVYSRLAGYEDVNDAKQVRRLFTTPLSRMPPVCWTTCIGEADATKSQALCHIDPAQRNRISCPSAVCLH